MRRLNSVFRGVTFQNMDQILDETAFFSVSMPKLMVVQNRRLGAILRLLQVTTVLSMAWYGFLMGGCYGTYEPEGYQQGLWFLPSESPGGSMTGQHCSHPTSYWHSFGEFISVRPTGCRYLPGEAAYYDFTSHVAGEAGIFFPTYMQYDTTAYGPENACHDSRSQGCSSPTTRDEFFMANPGEQRVSIFHGFRVGPGEARGGWEVRDSSTKGTLQTVIVRTDGSRCAVAGKSEWSAAEARAGISGRLMDWLACAGVSLDTDPRTLGPANEVGLAPHLRTMGFSMQFEVEYTSEGSINLCTMRVTVIPAWTVRKQTDLVELPGGLNNQTVLRVRTSTGVAVSLKVTGTFKHFDPGQALRFFCDSVVLLHFPVIVVRFLCLFGLGSLSSVYRRARVSRVDIYHDFHVAFAKMMIAIAGFRGMMGGIWTGHARELPGLTRACMLNQLADVFEEPLSQGQLNMDELRNMVALVFRHLDRDGTGEIGCSEFVHSFVGHDAIKIEDAVRFFSTGSRQGLVHRVLDDSQRRRRDSLRTMSGGSSEADLRAVAAAMAREGKQQQRGQVSFESPTDGSEATAVDDSNSVEPVVQGRRTEEGLNPFEETNPCKEDVALGIQISPRSAASGIRPSPRTAAIEATAPHWRRFANQATGSDGIQLSPRSADTGLRREYGEDLHGVLDTTSSDTWLEMMRSAFSEATAKDWVSADLWTPLTALQNTVADIERRLEKLEIKNMEDQFRNWKPHKRGSDDKGKSEESEVCLSSHKGFRIPMVEVGAPERAPGAPAEPDRELTSLGAFMSRQVARSPRLSPRFRPPLLPRPPVSPTQVEEASKSRSPRFWPTSPRRLPTSDVAC